LFGLRTPQAIASRRALQQAQGSLNAASFDFYSRHRHKWQNVIACKLTLVDPRIDLDDIHDRNPARAERVPSRLRAGAIHINGGAFNYGSPFGGCKQSGNGREGGLMGLEDYLETKTLHGIT